MGADMGAATASQGDGRTVRVAVLSAFFIGWSFLPVLHYPAHADPIGTIGVALPGADLITKAALLPLALCIAMAVAAPGSLARLRPAGLDAAVALFCAWPLFHGAAAQAAYLAAVWGGGWLLGRALLASPDARRDALGVAALAGLALLPIALAEGVRPAWLYGAVYGPHPFQADGVPRYIGDRPLGFFEDGNQYGIWVAMAALAAAERTRDDRRFGPVAALLAAMSLASQSAGAIGLMLIGMGLLVRRPTVPRWLLPAGAAMLLAGGVTYLSGAVPIDHIARDTRPGQIALAAFRKVGRGSLPWRISQDQRALPLIARHPLIGTAHHDWWRPVGRRPWGLPMLVIGQYGLIGLFLLATPMLAGALAVIRSRRRDERFALAAIVLLAAGDALLNSFVYFPAILFAGALAAPVRDVRQAPA